MYTNEMFESIARTAPMQMAAAAVSPRKSTFVAMRRNLEASSPVRNRRSGRGGLGAGAVAVGGGGGRAPASVASCDGGSGWPVASACGGGRVKEVDGC